MEELEHRAGVMAHGEGSDDFILEAPQDLGEVRDDMGTICGDPCCWGKGRVVETCLKV